MSLNQAPQMPHGKVWTVVGDIDFAHQQVGFRHVFFEPEGFFRLTQGFRVKKFAFVCHKVAGIIPLRVFEIARAKRPFLVIFPGQTQTRLRGIGSALHALLRSHDARIDVLPRRIQLIQRHVLRCDVFNLPILLLCGRILMAVFMRFPLFDRRQRGFFIERSRMLTALQHHHSATQEA